MSRNATRAHHAPSCHLLARPSNPAALRWLCLLGLIGLLLPQASPLAAVDLPPGKCLALQPTLEDFRLASESTTFDKEFPDTATAGTGRHIVVWESFGTNSGSDNDRHSIQGRIFEADGSEFKAQFQFNTLTAEEQRFPSVATRADGRFVAVWRSGSNFGLKQVRARIFLPNGIALGPDFLVNNVPVNEASTSFQTFPQVAMAANGTFLVVWDALAGPGTDSSNSSIQARLFNADGTPAAPQIELNQTTEGTQARPEVSAVPGGGFLVVWQSLRSSGSDRSGWSVQARRVSSTGVAQGAEVQVNSFTSSSQRYPAVASGAGGVSLVVWESDGSSGNDSDDESIQAQAIAVDGSLIGPEFQVNQIIAGEQLRPRVAAGPAGDFVVVWQSQSSGGNDDDGRSIQGRHIASPGRFFDVEFQINEAILDNQELPAISIGPETAMVVFYSDSYDGGLEFDSLGQILEGLVSPNSLCLNSRRFLVQVDWADGKGNAGEGSVVAGGSDDSGLFWFFNAANWEMLVKIIDGCPLNQNFWVYAAATTDVAYELRVTDLFTGDQMTYLNAQGNAADAITDTSAFATCDAGPSLRGDRFTSRTRSWTEFDGAEVARALSNDEASGALPGWSPGASRPEASPVRHRTDGLVDQSLAQCAPGSNSLCLQQSRFEVTVDYRTRQGETGMAKRVPFGSADSGLFWFFNASNWEMLVKIIDGCGLNQNFWVYAAATTDVEYTLRVRDTQTGDVAEYFNPLGTAAPAINDTKALATCP